MSETLDPVTRHHVHHAAEALKEEFAGSSPRRRSSATSRDSLDRLGSSRINVFVPVLAHRFARERLMALARREGICPMISLRCSSSACTTPAAARWPPGS